MASPGDARPVSHQLSTEELFEERRQYEQEIDRLRKQRDEVQNEWQLKTEDVNALQESLAVEKSRTAEQQGEINILKEEVSGKDRSHDSALLELDGRIQSLKEILQQKNDIIAGAHRQLEEKQVLEHRYVNLETELRNAKDDLALATVRVEDAHRDLEDFKTVTRKREQHYIDQFRVVCNDWTKSKQQIAAMLDQQDSHIDGATTRNGRPIPGEHSALLLSLKDQLSLAQVHNASYRERVVELEKEASDLKADLASARQQLDAARANGGGDARKPLIDDSHRHHDEVDDVQMRDAADNTLRGHLAALDSMVTSLDETTTEDLTVQDLTDRIGSLAELLDPIVADVGDKTERLRQEHLAHLRERLHAHHLRDQIKSLKAKIGERAHENEMLKQENETILREFVSSGKTRAAKKNGSRARASTVDLRSTKTSAPRQRSSATTTPTEPNPVSASTNGGDTTIGTSVNQSSSTSTHSRRQQQQQRSAQSTPDDVSQQADTASHRDSPTEPANDPRASTTSSTASVASGETVRGRVQALRERFGESGIQLPLECVGGNNYRLGSRRIQLSIMSGRLVVRAGGGWQNFLEYLSRTRI